MSQLGLREEEPEPEPPPEKSGYLWWPTASVPAACIFTSQAQQSAALSAKQITAAATISHASHWIFIPSSRRRPRSPILFSITRLMCPFQRTREVFRRKRTGFISALDRSPGREEARGVRRWTPP